MQAKIETAEEYRPRHIFEFMDLVKSLIKKGFSVTPSGMIYDFNCQPTESCYLWKAQKLDQIIRINFIAHQDTVIRVLEAMSK